jgi:hypothetical protein
VEVPRSIQRIEPFPECALAILNRIPPRASEVEQLQGLLEEYPHLLHAVDQIAVASGKYDDGAPLDFAAIIDRIGAAELIEITITLLVRGYLHRALTVLEDRRYWRYTLACAVCCQEIALPGEDQRLIVYVAGLLHDIGGLALIAAYPDKYANLLTLIDRMFREETGFDLLAREEMMFGMDHFATGSWLASTWGLPPWLCAITGKFDEKASGEYRTLVATIRTGTRLAHSLGFGYLEAAPRADIEQIMSQIPETWERWKTLDYWKHGAEHLCGKIQSKLSLYALAEPEDQ